MADTSSRFGAECEESDQREARKVGDERAMTPVNPPLKVSSRRVQVNRRAPAPRKPPIFVYGSHSRSTAWPVTSTGFSLTRRTTARNMRP